MEFCRDSSFEIEHRCFLCLPLDNFRSRLHLPSRSISMTIKTSKIPVRQIPSLENTN